MEILNFILKSEEAPIPIWGGIIGMILFLGLAIFFLVLFLKKNATLKDASEFEHLPFWTRSFKSFWPVFFLCVSVIFFLSGIAMLVLII